MLANKKMLIPVVVGVILLVVGGYLYFFKSNSSSITPKNSQTAEEIVATLKPDEIGLEFVYRADKKAVKFTIAKASDIKAIEYQIAYTKKVNGEEIPEGLIGEVPNDTGKASLTTDFRELGTCSSKVCRYDVVVSDVKLILKITKTDGKVFQVEDSLPL